MTPEQVNRIRELGQLKEEGILSEAEFAAKKAEVLGGSAAVRTASQTTASARSMAGARCMGFGEAISTCFAQYLSVNGRATRSEYWYFYLFLILVNIPFSLLDTALGFDEIGIFESIWSLVTAPPLICAAARRLHDIGKSGWWQLIPLTCVGIPILIYWLCKKSEEDTNAYGPNPFTVPPLNQG